MNSKPLLKMTLALVLSAASMGSLAAISDADAAKLGNTLTPVGADPKGNADGTIPAWSGGMTAPPAGYQPGGSRIDPFADEKPLFTIDASNFQQYADKLTEGQKALFQKYPDSFKMPIYPTHRTAAAPQWVYDKTATNAVNTRLTEDGNGVLDLCTGYPFPIPQNGLEALWNHTLRWQGTAVERSYLNLVVNDDGSLAIGGASYRENHPYLMPNKNTDCNPETVLEILVNYDLPIRRKGEVLVVRDPVNQNITPRQAWQYIPGQRRVRRAPTIAFDTPNSSVSGLSTYDDDRLFNGSPERYNWKLVEKREMYIPYNNNALFVAGEQGDDKVREIFTPGHQNPEYSRWELHRVWVVEGTLKDDQRHIYSKRTYYLDEDSWAAVAGDLYDGRGELWRAVFANMLNAYDVPLTYIGGQWQVDFQSGDYGVTAFDVKPVRVYEGEKDSLFTPKGIRQISRR